MEKLKINKGNASRTIRCMNQYKAREIDELFIHPILCVNCSNGEILIDNIDSVFHLDYLKGDC